MTFFMPESYAPRLLQVKANKLKKATGRQDLQPLLTLNMPKKELFIRSIVRPLKVSRAPGKSTIIAYAESFSQDHQLHFASALIRPSSMEFYVRKIMSSVDASTTAEQYLVIMFTTIPAVFRDIYGWSARLSGLAYTGSE